MYKSAHYGKACYRKHSLGFVFRIDPGRACVTHHAAMLTGHLTFALLYILIAGHLLLESTCTLTGS